MISAGQARQLALALPEAVEQDHHGRPSFRVAGRIFATLWDETHMNVMLDEPGILTAVQGDPDSCAEVWWGKRLAAVRVNLGRAEVGLVADLLADAWEGKAPKKALEPSDPGADLGRVTSSTSTQRYCDGGKAEAKTHICRHLVVAKMPLPRAMRFLTPVAAPQPP